MWTRRYRIAICCFLMYTLFMRIYVYWFVGGDIEICRQSPGIHQVGRCGEVVGQFALQKEPFCFPFQDRDAAGRMGRSASAVRSVAHWKVYYTVWTPVREAVLSSGSPESWSLSTHNIDARKELPFGASTGELWQTTANDGERPAVHRSGSMQYVHRF